MISSCHWRLLMLLLTLYEGSLQASLKPAVSSLTEEWYPGEGLFTPAACLQLW